MTKISMLYFSLLCHLGLKKGEIRPWGGFETLRSGKNYQVKRIWVDAGKRLSLQSHKHRSEVWVVVEGVAIAEKDGKEFKLEKGDYITIPLGARHRLSNTEKKLLLVIEVQNGDYLAEDDIIRYEDDFNRL